MSKLIDAGSGKKPRRKKKAPFVGEIEKNTIFFGPFTPFTNRKSYKGKQKILEDEGKNLKETIESLESSHPDQIKRLEETYSELAFNDCTYINPMSIINTCFADARSHWKKEIYATHEFCFDKITKFPNIELACARFPYVYADEEFKDMNRPGIDKELRHLIKHPLIYNISGSFGHNTLSNFGFYIIFKPKKGDKNNRQGLFMPIIKGDPRVPADMKHMDMLCFKVKYQDKPRQTRLYVDIKASPHDYDGVLFNKYLQRSIEENGGKR